MDITKCNSQNCPNKDKCYRYTCESNPMWQSYSDFQKDCKENKFRNFIKIGS